MAGTKTDETALRLRAAELAIGAISGTNPASFTDMATSILTFITGAGQAAARPTPSTPATTDTSAAAGVPASGDKPGLDAPGTSVSGGQSSGDGTQSDAGSDDVFDGSEAAVTRLKAKCTALAARDGGNALLAEFQALGAKSWSGVPADKYGELYASLVAKGV